MIQNGCGHSTNSSGSLSIFVHFEDLFWHVWILTLTILVHRVLWKWKWCKCLDICSDKVDTVFEKVKEALSWMKQVTGIIYHQQTLCHSSIFSGN
ncbi:hypothetical protein TNIN_279661 [Trichonephila inaurata madagascariensis]|uniref:Transmembrane protein n=1 Tax=Trichonephila inaurata madagascariensis TaxID=2747483 RepID=A0A8X6MFH6_9ARAC|nr:hypothetical protein TNIN_279661 [Trichonephila inaurata madagascariensis]